MTDPNANVNAKPPSPLPVAQGAGGNPDVVSAGDAALAYSAPPPPVARRKRVLTVVLLVAALVAGVALGFAGHGRIGHWFGLHGRTAAAGGKKELWTCGMHPQVLKDGPGLCPICQMKLEPLDLVQSGGSAMTGAGDGAGMPAERKVKYWWDPMMNPPYIAQQPGKSPMGMDLVPVYEDEVSGGIAVKIDPVIVQNMGVRLAEVGRGPVRREVRAVGYLAESEPNVRDVNLRVSGWVERLHADTVGMALSKGSPLFDLYSPEVQVGVEELIAARRSIGSGGGAVSDSVVGRAGKAVLEAARRKLELWGLDEQQVERLAALAAAPKTVTFTSPIDGYLTQKMIVQGAAVKAGDPVLRIVDLSTVWLDAQVHAQDLPVVQLGQTVTAVVEGVPGKDFDGKVVFVAPQVDQQTRTATVRVALPNNELVLRPGMFATARLRAELAADALLVPREAVIDTGTRQIVFVAADDGHFEPRRVKVGLEGDGGTVQVLEGLAAGEQVVTSGQFLLDAESRMREAIEKHLSDRLAGNAKPPAAGHAGHTPPSSTIAATPPGGIGPAGHDVHASHGAVSADVDPLFREYLVLQSALGAPQQADSPVNADGLVKAARAVADAAEGDVRHHAAIMADAARAMQGRPLPEQRAQYKAVSNAAIALAAAAPPSQSVAGQLFVAYCPMAPGEGGRWLQASSDVANPYFATAMKACGSIERTIPTRAAAGTRPATAPNADIPDQQKDDVP